MGLKIIDGTPTAISKFIREQEYTPKKEINKKIKELEKSKKSLEKKLPELQLEEMYCVFCGESSDKVEGGYFMEKFLCRSCSRKLNETDSFL